MSTTPEKTVLITGANAGIGKEVARQLASRPEMARIYLACRNRDRATTAKAELEAETGRPAGQIDHALRALQTTGQATVTQIATGGRPAQLWTPTS